MSSFYIASRLENAAQVKRLADILVSAGHTHTYDWTVHGSVQNEGESRIHEVAQLERAGVVTADLVIVVLPGGRGTHAELGIALGLNKPVLICAATDEAFRQDERTCAFYWADNVARATGAMEDWLALILPEMSIPWVLHRVAGVCG